MGKMVKRAGVQDYVILDLEGTITTLPFFRTPEDAFTFQEHPVLCPHVRTFLREQEAYGRTRVLATAGPTDQAMHFVERAGIENLFDLVLGGDYLNTSRIVSASDGRNLLVPTRKDIAHLKRLLAQSDSYADINAVFIGNMDDAHWMTPDIPLIAVPEAQRATGPWWNPQEIGKLLQLLFKKEGRTAGQFDHLYDSADETISTDEFSDPHTRNARSILGYHLKKNQNQNTHDLVRIIFPRPHYPH